MLTGPMIVAFVTGMVVTGASVALAQGSLPDSARTPGAINPAVTQENIGETICVRGWTRGVRPPQEFTYQLKRRQMREYGYFGRRLSDFEEDHLVSLSIGGASEDPRNLWPEPRETADGWNAGRKDKLEAVLARLVCEGRVPLAEAQAAMATDWIAAYRLSVTGAP